MRGVPKFPHAAINKAVESDLAEWIYTAILLYVTWDLTRPIKTVKKTRPQRLKRLDAITGGGLSRGGWYRCTGCKWEWRYDGLDNWYGPRGQDENGAWDHTCTRAITTDVLDEEYSGCFGKLKYRSHFPMARKADMQRAMEIDRGRDLVAGRLHICPCGILTANNDGACGHKT